MPRVTLRPRLNHGVTATTRKSPGIHAECNSALGHDIAMRREPARIDAAREVARGILAIERLETWRIRAGLAQHLDLFGRKGQVGCCRGFRPASSSAASPSI